MTCLEEVGLDFESKVVAFRAGEAQSDRFLDMNHAARVPVLVVDGKALKENVAIISYIDQSYPDAGILPSTADHFQRAAVIADLAFCASVLHPIVTRIRIPEKFTTVEQMRSDIWQVAVSDMHKHFAYIERRLSRGGPWWYGEQWSALDSYIGWVWFRVEGARMPLGAYPNFAQHARQLAARPAVQRALERERIGQEDLSSRGLEITFSPVEDWS